MPAIETLRDRLLNLGHSPTDTPEQRVRKSSVTLVALLKAPGCFVWAAMYMVLGLRVASYFPFGYMFIIVGSIALFGWLKNYELLLRTMLGGLLLLPFGLQLHLGGLAPSGAVSVWAFLSPLGALFFGGPRYARPWFLAFLLLFGGAAFAEAYLSSPVHVEPWVARFFFLMNISGVGGICFFTMRYFSIALKREKDRAEGLLLNILPETIAERMKAGAAIIADQFDEVGVLFADLIGFTELSSKTSADELVMLLDEIFSEFDRLVEKNGVEKIKTIGDAYMVVAGAPRSLENSLGKLACLALEMPVALHGIAAKHGISLAVRMGMHVGQVVAGVIGKKKFAYDLWGDTVNIASRMESHGSAGKIHVTEAVYRALGSTFAFEARGTITVKGKGEMATYFLSGAS